MDPRSGQLNGLIDLGDAMLGDPMLDFVGLVGLGGYRFIERVQRSYELALSETFTAKLVWFARTLTLTWLADAAERAPEDLAKRQAWVSYAFDEPSGSSVVSRPRPACPRGARPDAKPVP